jgi:glycosyltransferase involved in cell wall biosynthesis
LAVGVVLPVHDEEELLPTALASVSDALAGLPPQIETRVAVVLDDCSDMSSDIATEWSRRHEAVLVTERARNVGAARRAGCQAILSGWHELRRETIWLATTDADSRVPADWLTAQLTARAGGVDLWAGRVTVTDWSGHHDRTRGRWRAAYAGEHDPVHGASLGVSAATYVSLGGFRPLPTGEDRDLYRRAQARQWNILHDTDAVVETSARREGRAPLGFAHALITMEEDLASTA